MSPAPHNALCEGEERFSRDYGVCEWDLYGLMRLSISRRRIPPLGGVTGIRSLTITKKYFQKWACNCGRKRIHFPIVIITK